MNNYLCSGYIYEACSIINFNKKAIALKTKDFCICDVYYDVSNSLLKSLNISRALKYP